MEWRQHQRALRWQQVRAAMAERWEPTPGPGSYDPRAPKSDVPKMTGSAAFKSKSSMDGGSGKGRAASFLREMGDPGSYRVFGHTLASSTSRSGSFGASQRSGASGFGSVSERAEWGGPGRLGPGPLAAGNTRKGWLDSNAKRGRMSSGFATKSTRSESAFGGFLNVEALHTPTFIYNPGEARRKLEKKPPECGFVLKSNTPRFASDATASPGPSGHVPNNHTLARAARERLRDFRHAQGTRDDLFRPPRVRV